MAEAARQVATLAVLVSQHAFVTHRAVVALQHEEQKRRQQQLQLFVHIHMVGKVKTNASKSKQMSYDHYKCLAIRPKLKKKTVFPLTRPTLFLCRPCNFYCLPEKK